MWKNRSIDTPLKESSGKKMDRLSIDLPGLRHQCSQLKEGLSIIPSSQFRGLQILLQILKNTPTLHSLSNSLISI